MKEMMLVERTGQEKEKQAMERLHDYMTGWMVFIDTCSFMSDFIDLFMEHVIPELRRAKTRIYAPYNVYRELVKHYQGNRPDTKQKARRALLWWQKLEKEELIQGVGSNEDAFADNDLKMAMILGRMKHRMLLITEDRRLAADVLRLNEDQSVRCNMVHVMRISRYGYLARHAQASENAPSDRQSGPSGSPAAPSGPAPGQQDKGISFPAVPGLPYKAASEIPGENDRVWDADKTGYTLGRQVAAGGEGVLFDVGRGMVAKIYRKERLDRRRYEKLQKMIGMRLSYPGICFPVSILYNGQSEFVGCLMPRAEGVELGKSVFQPMLFKRKFPDWTKLDTVNLCITILQMEKYLQKHSVLIGDINPQNFLVVSPKKVSLVDTDSMQIPGFPCPVGTVPFTAPEIQGKDFGTFFRSKGNENFALAVLLFMIMLPGKHPYAQQDGGSLKENIRSRRFPYPLGGKSNKNAPDGPWRFIWSQMPYSLKEVFYNTFEDGMKFCPETCRPGPELWLQVFSKYAFCLENGYLQKNDSEANEIWPKRLKLDRSEDGTNPVIRCKICGLEDNESRMREGICKRCLYKGEEYVCRWEGCNEKLIYTNLEKHVLHRPKYTYCKACAEKARNKRAAENRFRADRQRELERIICTGSPAVVGPEAISRCIPAGSSGSTVRPMHPYAGSFSRTGGGNQKTGVQSSPAASAHAVPAKQSPSVPAAASTNTPGKQAGSGRLRRLLQKLFL